MSTPTPALPRRRLLILLLTALVAIGPVSTDMYLPALPDISDALGVTPAGAQATLSMFLLSFAFAQLVIGPLSDRFGRRPILVGGLVVYVVASMLAALSVSIEGLVAARFVQAAGACAGGVLARTIVRDLFDRNEAAHTLATLGLIMATAPVVAPLLGGYVVVWAGWAGVFWVMAGAGALLFLAAFRLLPETNAFKNPLALQIGPMIANYRTLLRSGPYMGYLLVNAFVFGGMFAYISGASFILIDGYGIATDRFGYYFAIPVFGYMAGNALTRRLVGKWGTERLILGGTLFAMVSGWGALGLVVAGLDGPLSLVLVVAVYLVGLGLVLPNSMAGALQPYPEKAGAASALLGFTHMMFAALAGFAVGLLHDGTPLPTTIIIAVMATMALGSFLVLLYPEIRKQRQ